LQAPTKEPGKKSLAKVVKLSTASVVFKLLISKQEKELLRQAVELPILEEEDQINKELLSLK
jgi:hypothetical protein